MGSTRCGLHLSDLRSIVFGLLRCARLNVCKSLAGSGQVHRSGVVGLEPILGRAHGGWWWKCVSIPAFCSPASVLWVVRPPRTNPPVTSIAGRHRSAQTSFAVLHDLLEKKKRRAVFKLADRHLRSRFSCRLAGLRPQSTESPMFGLELLLTNQLASTAERSMGSGRCSHDPRGVCARKLTMWLPYQILHM